MQIEQRPLTSIQPYGKNAKKHPSKQINQIADSIREFGFNQPIVVDKAGVIIVGHGRYAAAHLVGMDEVPVLEIDIDDEKAKAYRLADNKLNESEWDMELVISELKTLSLPTVDLTGFERRLVLKTNINDDDVPKWAKAEKMAEKEGRTTIWTMKRAPVQDYVHPTQKPVELVMYAIHNSSKVDDIVLDPFLGSGSVLIACEKTNRICYGMELDPQFADVIVERYCQFMGTRNIKKNGESIIW
jgi:hypothetical protein